MEQHVFTSSIVVAVLWLLYVAAMIIVLRGEIVAQLKEQGTKIVDPDGKHKDQVQTKDPECTCGEVDGVRITALCLVHGEGREPKTE